MKEGTAIELAQKRMEELGIDNYLIKYRHLQIPPQKKKVLDGENHIYFLILPSDYVSVSSKAGIYNINDVGINEMQYIHRGKITIENFYLKNYLQVKFIQVIPIHNKDQDGI